MRLCRIRRCPGYEIIREYGQRVIPFFEITYISQVGVGSDPSELDRAVSEKLKGSFYIGDLSIRRGASAGKLAITSGELYSIWDRADDVQRFWPERKASLERLLGSATDEQYFGNLYEAVNYPSFDHFFVSALERRRVRIPIVSNREQIVDAVYDSKANDGSYS